MDEVIIAPTGNILTDEAIDTLAEVIIRLAASGKVVLNLTATETLPGSLIYYLVGRLVASNITHPAFNVRGSVDRVAMFQAAYEFHTGDRHAKKPNL